MLYELEKAQKDVLDKTEQEKKERIRRILEGNKAENPAAPDAAAPATPAPSAAPSETAKPAAESPQP